MSHRRTTARARALTAAAAAAIAALTLGGCQGDASADADAKGGGPSVVAPGKPGEAAETLSADEAKKAMGDDSPNSADFAYVQKMIEHHGQALELTGLVPERAKGRSVERLAARVAAAQRPEIGAMKGWLKKHGGERKGDSGAGHGHDHGSMPGMATEQQVEQLRSARGSDFDELFLKLMITHHQGAVTMATEALSDGNNTQVEEMANDVIAQQTSEIGRMRQLP